MSNCIRVLLTTNQDGSSVCDWARSIETDLQFVFSPEQSHSASLHVNYDSFTFEVDARLECRGKIIDQYSVVGKGGFETIVAQSYSRLVDLIYSVGPSFLLDEINHMIKLAEEDPADLVAVNNVVHKNNFDQVLRTSVFKNRPVSLVLKNRVLIYDPSSRHLSIFPFGKASRIPYWIIVVNNLDYTIVGPFDTKVDATSWASETFLATDIKWELLEKADVSKSTIVPPCEYTV